MDKNTVKIGTTDIEVMGVFSKENIQTAGETKVFNELRQNEENKAKFAELMQVGDVQGVMELGEQLQKDARKIVADKVKSQLNDLTKYVIIDGELFEFKGGSVGSGGSKNTPDWVKPKMIVWYKGAQGAFEKGGLFEVTDNLKCRSLRTNEVKGASTIANELTGRDGNSGFYRQGHWGVVKLNSVSNAIKVELELAKEKGFWTGEYKENNN